MTFWLTAEFFITIKLPAKYILLEGKQDRFKINHRNSDLGKKTWKI